MSNYPGAYIPPLVPATGPPRRTYGKKRILDPELLDIRDSDLPMKKTRTLAPLPINASKPPSLPKPVLLPTSSPIKRVGQDQNHNALDSPFLEPRSKRGVLRRTSSTRKPTIQPPPKPITSRHFSLNQTQNQRKNLKPKYQDELRRKTSAATTTVFVSSSDHSWLVPPPPRPRSIKTRYMSTGDAEFSFNPPAESTLHQGSPTPRASMQNHRKRHDSIISTDSDDDGETISVTRLFGAPPLLLKAKPKMSMDLDVDNDATPRAPPLIEQLCRSRSGSANATIRPLNLSFRQADAMDADDEMDANREAPVKRSDSALRALADACASMGLDEPDRSSPPATRPEPSSPTDRPARRHRKTRSVPGPSRSPKPVTRRLSPGAVYRLSRWPRVGMRIEAKALSPNEDTDTFATYDFDNGVIPNRVTGSSNDF